MRKNRGGTCVRRAAALWTLITATAAAGLAAQEPAGGRAAAIASDRPTLVVLISVDQLRGDLVERYASAFTGGFRRFLDKGFRYTRASHAHAATLTAVGHATLSTGVFPARSGIVANTWRQRDGDEWVSTYAVEDVQSPILGYEDDEDLEGRSPRNLLRTGLADWVRAADPEARSASISLKDRAAVTLGGQTRDNVYWLASPLARVVTSTYYAQAYPDWITRFNEEVMPGMVADTVWRSAVPEMARDLARADEASYEGDGVHTTFPHLSREEAGVPGSEDHHDWILHTSRADQVVRELAEVAVEELELGQRGHVDYLGLSFSATDLIGHEYGPLSQEQLSNLVELDHTLGELFAFFDAHVGEGRWVAGLSADHGVVTAPEAARAMGNVFADRIDSGRNGDQLDAALAQARTEGGTSEEIAERTARLLEEQGIVARAYTHQELTHGMAADSFAVLFRNSYYPGRATSSLSRYGIELRYHESDLVRGPTGTTHGSPYWYDRHVPFMLLGAGVSSGSSEDAVYTVDVAPTLAALAGVAVPYDLDGRAVVP